MERRNSSQMLGTMTGLGLGIAGVPGGGLIGSAVGLAAGPRCEAFIPVAFDPRYRQLARPAYVDPVPRSPRPAPMGYGEN
ncbi:MAG: hypothetical protein ACRC7G_01170 [Beijerinckiaceae bacterium]